MGMVSTEQTVRIIEAAKDKPDPWIEIVVGVVIIIIASIILGLTGRKMK